MSKLVDKVFNKLGYYRLVPNKYYETIIDDETRLVDINKWEGKFDFEEVKKAVKHLLISMGEDVNRPGLIDTPRRVAGYWQELLEGENYTNKEIAEKYRKDFQVSSNPLVIKQINNVFSHCEHHLALMFNGTVYVAYIPEYWNGKDDRDGYRVIGLSKIPRIVEMCAKRLQLQEKLATDIAECITLATGSKQVYVKIRMDHGCVSARGVKSDGVTDVTYITPSLRKDRNACKEIESKILNYNK